MIGTLVATVSKGNHSPDDSLLQSRLEVGVVTPEQPRRSYRWGPLAVAVTGHPLAPGFDQDFQPAIVSNARYCAFFWGRLDRSSPPAISVLAQIMQHGPHKATSLSGDFVIVLADHQNAELTVIRDPLGSRSVFWTAEDSGHWIATDERCLWPTQARPNPCYIANFFAAQTPPATATPIAGVNTLAPAHWLKITRSGAQPPRRYWQFVYDRDARKLNPKDAASAMREQLTAAVSERLSGDEAIAISGGVDSTAIAAVGQFERGLTYQLTDWPKCQEHTLAMATGSHLGIEVEPVNCDLAAPLSQEFWSTPGATWGPEIDAYRAMRWTMAKAATRAGHSSLVTGDFADQLYLGYPYGLRDNFRHHPWSSLKATLGRIKDQPAFWRDPLLRRIGPLNGISRGRRRQARPWLTDYANETLGLGDRSHPYYGQLAQVDRIEGCLNASTARAAHLGYLQGLRWGVEFRHPYRQQGLVQWMLSLSADNWLDPVSGQTKPVMRRAMSPLLPAQIVDRKDKTSLEPWFRHAVLTTHREKIRERLANNPQWQSYVSRKWLDERWQRADWDSTRLYVLWCCISMTHWISHAVESK